jgi:Flp pilus assembly pilin Flp
MCETDTNTAATGFGRLRCEEGQTLVEYGLILMFVSITALGLSPLGEFVANTLGGIAAAI